MKNGIKYLCILSLILILVMSLVGCGSGGASSSVDVDLTELSSTMIYSEVSNMVTNPDDYVGQTVKMSGQFAVYYDEQTKENYFACIVADATACCQQGLEFVLAGDNKYPEDYPEQESEITVQGTFSTYKIGEQTYFTLKDAQLL